MINDSFDPHSPAIIEPRKEGNAPKVDVCILTFSHKIEQYVRENYSDREIVSLKSASGKTPIYCIERGGKRIEASQLFHLRPITT